LRVLVLPSWYFPSGSGDLTGRNFHRHALALRQHGVDARIFYGDFSLTAFSKKNILKVTEDGVPTYRISRWHLPRLHQFIIRSWIRKYGDALREYFMDQGKPDVIHAQSYLAACIAQEVKSKNGIPFIYTEHLSNFLNGSIPARHHRAISKMASQADIITCVSTGLKEKVAAFTSKPIEVVPNFFSASVFYPGPLSQKPLPFTWITVGDPARTKGVDLIIAAFAILQKKTSDPDMKLIITDAVTEEKEMRKLASQYGVADQIEWTGLISQRELAEKFRSSHAYVSVSRVETFGTAIIEAQACGLPVVATKTAGAQYILADPPQGILVEPENTGDLVRGMMEMRENYTRYDQQKISRLTKEKFEESRVLQQWMEIYRKFA
jgi:glycosyltransferase involved in cell wall biosynthesis